jgi:hypothetical protein
MSVTDRSDKSARTALNRYRHHFRNEGSLCGRPGDLTHAGRLPLESLMSAYRPSAFCDAVSTGPYRGSNVLAELVLRGLLQLAREGLRARTPATSTPTGCWASSSSAA